MEAVTVQFRYTQEEFVKAERKFLFASKAITKTSMIILGLYLPFSIWYLFSTNYSAISIVSVCVALLATALGCMVYFYIPISRYKQTTKFQEEYNLTFSAEGIHFQTASINSGMKWDVYTELWDCGDYYFLVQGPRVYTMLPKRVFAKEAEQEAFEAIATAQTQKPKRVC